MTIVNVDIAKSLEWVTLFILSQDKTGIEEWHNVVNDPTKFVFHLTIKKKFNLPSRLIAKVFFVFVGFIEEPAFGYCHDQFCCYREK